MKSFDVRTPAEINRPSALVFLLFREEWSILVGELNRKDDGIREPHPQPSQGRTPSLINPESAGVTMDS